MSERLTPLPPPQPTAIDRYAAPQAPPQRWAPPVAPPPGGGGSNPMGNLVARSVAAIRRYKWLSLVIVGLGTVAGVAATSLIQPRYAVQGSLWLSGSETPLDARQGPIRASEVFRGPAWVELMQSFRIADSVVARQALYITPEREADSLLFRDFRLGPRLRPGTYELEVDANRRWVLRDAATEREFERGAAGDSVGRKLGFRWAPPAALLPVRGTVEFTAITPREAALELKKNFNAGLGQDGAFVQVTLSDLHPQRAANTLNSWMQEFVKVATEFRRAELGQFAKDLATQLDSSEISLKNKELALQNYRATTITEPGESAPVVAGIELQNPVIGDLFKQKVDLDQNQRDLAQLRSTISGIRAGTQPADAVLFIPSVASGPQGDQLRQALQQLSERKGALRSSLLYYTEEAPRVKQQEEDIRKLERETIPQIAQQYASELSRRVGAIQGRVSTSEATLRKIPERTIEEARLTRDVNVASNLYVSLKNRYDEAQLAEKSAAPGIQIMDEAIAPLRPTTNTKPQIILGSFLASLAVGVLIALLLDRLDRRFRYPEQVTDDLGLEILGAVPALRNARAREVSPEEASQMVEAFRSIRLALRHSFASDGPVVVAITSAGMGDGKSFVSSNLAMSFAEAGHRTLLIDGDIRRGEQHATFNIDQQPGLIDFLSGDAGLDEVIVPTEYDRLSLMPCGTRRRRGPELLASANMTSLVDNLRLRYDAIIIDSAPLGAGTDAYALGVAAGSTVLVFREGKTDRKMAQAKLSVLDRLPVHMAGAVLNCVPTKGGAYEYYGYLDGYTAEEADELGAGDARGRLTAGPGATR